MHTDTEGQRRLPRCEPLGGDLLHTLADRERARRGTAGTGRSVSVRAEDRHHPVSGELVDDAAVLEHRSGERPQVVVDHGHDPHGIRHVREHGRTPQVGEQDGDRLALSGDRRVTCQHTVDHGRRKEALQPTTAVELPAKAEERVGDQRGDDRSE